MRSVPVVAGAGAPARGQWSGQRSGTSPQRLRELLAAFSDENLSGPFESRPAAVDLAGRHWSRKTCISQPDVEGSQDALRPLTVIR